MSTVERRLHLDPDRLRAYSRRGNFHADPDEARRLGLPGLVAQGMQVGAPAYGVLLDTWGEDFLAHGTLDWTFVGMVLEDEVVAASVEIDDEASAATVTVVSDTSGRTVLVGSATRRAG